MRISDWSSDVCSSDLPILARLILALGPLDQQPLLFSWFLDPLVAVRGTHAHSRVTRCEPVDRAFLPRDRLPGGIGQAEGERLGLDRKRTRLHYSQYCASRLPSSALNKTHTINN